MPNPLRLSGASVDLSPRVFYTSTVAASPSAATETIIASLTLTSDVLLASGVILEGFAAYTVGASGVGVNLKIRRTDASGTTVAATGITTATAANLDALSVRGFDTGATLPNQVYVLTMTVASGAATSTVSAAHLIATLI